MKKKLFVSFSGGETSAFMCNWLLNNKSNEYEMKFVFANTGEENEETLRFVEQCDRYFGLDLTWVEFDIVKDKPSFKVVDFGSAYRSHKLLELEKDPKTESGTEDSSKTNFGSQISSTSEPGTLNRSESQDPRSKNKWENHPFRKMIARQGIPNRENMICTRELKQYPMTRFLSSIGWKKSDYQIAIGIRADEIDRIGKFYYPLVEANITKPMVNAFWDKMPFRLQLKGYQGNCKTCWKKSFRKLGTIALEDPKKFEFMTDMEREFKDFTAPGRVPNPNFNPPHYFFRENKSIKDIFEIPKKEGFEVAIDDSINTNYQYSILHDGTELDVVNGCVESCEIEF